MYGLKDKAGRLVNKGHSINLTNESPQKDFEKALKRVPSLKGKNIIELTAAQIKEREAKKNSKPKTVENDSKKAKGE